MRNAGLDESQSEIQIAGRNINNLRYTDDTTLIAESVLGTRVHPWWIHVDVWQNQYNIVK